jgi:3-isopropylmalate dehydrogenase
MTLRYSFDMGEDADLIEKGVTNLLASGKRTGDIMQAGKELVSCTGMGESLIAELDKLAA